MNCTEIDDLLPGYMLGALEPDEMDAGDAHLAACREHDEELARLHATGIALALLDDAVDDARNDAEEPSPHLRDRVRAAAGPVPLPIPLRARPPHDEADDPLDADEEIDDDGAYEVWPSAGDPRPRSSFGVRRPRWWWLTGVAAALALVMFGAGWYAGSRSAPAAQQTVRYSYEMRGPSGQLVRFAGIEGSERVTVTMDGLQAQPEGRQYQVWAIRDGEWVALGRCNTNARGWWRGDFEFTLHRGEEVALTVEPTGGSAKPTAPALLRTKL